MFESTVEHENTNGTLEINPEPDNEPNIISHSHENEAQDQDQAISNKPLEQKLLEILAPIKAHSSKPELIEKIARVLIENGIDVNKETISKYYENNKIIKVIIGGDGVCRYETTVGGIGE
ncbi:MAG: hypothetical protein SFT68_03745 [Rickettsiaceae bacterium]|nr:hypothetical protein [Rickettsiaceae bacterium]